MAPTVIAIVPAGIDDQRRPSGGNRYDRRVLDSLGAQGWQVREEAVTGAWPHPGAAGRRALAAALDGAPTGVPVLLDGLVAGAAADLVTTAAARSPVVVLLHMPLGTLGPALAAAEQRALSAASAVVTTSDWTRDWLARNCPLPAGRVHVAAPGTDPAAPASGTPAGHRLLCVAAVTRAKGHDVLLAALGELTEPGPSPESGWQCICVGSLDIEPGFVQELRMRARSSGLGGRVRFVGALEHRMLEQRYAATDLLILPSRRETWGMVITEALARSVPVIASDVGGIPQAVGRVPDGRRPGLLVPAGDPHALAGALRRWLGEPALRARLREDAATRRATLAGWDETAARIAVVLRSVQSGEPRPCPAGVRKG